MEFTLSMDEYREKLNTLKENAQKEDRKFVALFLEELLKHEPEDIGVYEFVYRTVDDITSDLAEYYLQLLTSDANVAWYELLSLANEEKASPKELIALLYEAYEQKIDIELVKGWLNESSSASDFSTRVAGHEKEKPTIEPKPVSKEETVSDSNMFINHLREENQRLNDRLAKAEQELKEMRSEAKASLNDSFSNRKESLELKMRYEQLQRRDKHSETALRLAESKVRKYKEICDNMDKAMKELRSRTQSVDDYSSEIAELKEQIDSLQNLIADKNSRIASLEQTLERYEQRIMELEQIPSYEETVPNTEGDVSMEDVDDFKDGIGFTDFDLPDMDDEIGNEYDESLDEEEFDYDPADIIEIKDNIKEIENQSSILAKLFPNRYKKKFEKKTSAEQENMIFLKMMENEFSKDIVKTVKAAIRTNYVSRYELFELISRRATDQEIIDYCRVAV